MINVWFLVIFFGTSGGYGKGVDHIPFETQQECVDAQQIIEKQAGGGVYYACVQGVMK